MANGETRAYKRQDCHQQRACIQQQYGPPCHFYGDGIYIVACRVKMGKTPILLGKEQCQSQNIADEQTSYRDEGGEGKKYPPNGGISGSQCFEDADCARALNNQNEQTAYHGKSCYGKHQDNDDKHISVEQVEP